MTTPSPFDWRNADDPVEYRRLLMKFDRAELLEHMREAVGHLGGEIIGAWESGNDTQARVMDAKIRVLLDELKRRWQEDWWRYR